MEKEKVVYDETDEIFIDDIGNSNIVDNSNLLLVNTEVMAIDNFNRCMSLASLLVKKGIITKSEFDEEFNRNKHSKQLKDLYNEANKHLKLIQ